MGRKTRAVTRSDVARRAGTSTAVVSYVVNDGPRPVAAATRERVQRAIDELGYRTNTIARALRVQRSRLLGLVVPDNSNPYFGEIARYVEQACFEYGYMLFLGNSTLELNRQRQYIDTFIDSQVDGLLVMPRDRASAPAATVRDIPVELIETIDNERVGFTAAQHLIDHGHRKIGAIAGESGVWPATERIEGYQRAMYEAGLAAEMIAPSEFTTLGAVQAGRRLLAKPGLTAIFAPTDVQGLGALKAADLEGRRVPSGLAVVAADGTRAAGLATPGLTTVAQPMEQLARRAVDRLLARIENTDRDEPGRGISTTLIRRGSCGCRETI